MKNKPLEIFQRVKKEVNSLKIPFVSKISEKKDPYKVLISCIISLRTKDETTAFVSQKLFKVADNPYKMSKLSLKKLQELLYPCGFYRNKARTIKEISKKIISHFQGKVPPERETLLKFKGVGRKTANLVLGLGYGIPSICVDTHLHRIFNRLGLVSTKTPFDTEKALESIYPKRYWVSLNNYFVAFGQNICLPISPYCSRCVVNKFCLRKAVDKHR